MNAVKILAGFACTILILICVLFFFIENPEQELYENTVESLMVYEGLTSWQEVLDAFPELKEIKFKMKRIAQLKTRGQNMSGGPAPNLSREESQQLQQIGHEIRHLQKIVKEELTQLLTNYENAHP